MNNRQYYYYLSCILNECNPFLTKIRYNADKDIVVCYWFSRHGTTYIDCKRHSRTDITYYLLGRALDEPLNRDYEKDYVEMQTKEEIIDEILMEVDDGH